MNQKLRDSIIGRAQPKRRRRFYSAILNKLTRHRTDTGLVEDSTSSTIIIRVIVGLLLLHLAIIGGALLRGELKKGSIGAAVTSTITAPPTTAEQTPAGPAFPETAPATVTPAAPSTSPGAVRLTDVHPVTTPQTATRTQADTGNHITQMPAVADDDTAEEVTPTAPARTRTATPAQPAGTVLVKHLVASGDTWSSIALANGTTVDALKAANPDAARRINLIAGSYIKVPVAGDSPQARTAAAQQAAAAAQEKVHVIAKGETLGGIARKYKLSLKKLMQLNGMTDADARKIRPGQKLKVSQ